MVAGSGAGGPRVLVTGASGFLGGHVMRELDAHGYGIIAHGRDEARLLAALPAGAVTLLGELGALARERVEADAVIHGAALSTAWGPWRDFRRANVEGTAAVVECVRRSGIRRLVFVSSPSVYSAASDRLGLTEDDVAPGRPLNHYIHSKLEAEALLREAHARGDVPELVIVRPRGLTGAGDPSLLPRLLAAQRRTGIPLVDGGGHLVELTAVENVALALRLALESGAANGGTYHVSNGDPRPFVELVEQLFAHLGVTPRYRPLTRRKAVALAAALEGAGRLLPGAPEPPLTRYTVTTIAFSLTLDLSRARADLGYAPRVSLDDALAALAASVGGRD